jgi:hypothetical protein
MSIVVEQQSDTPPEGQIAGLVSWINARVDRWREFRDNNHKEKWDEYYRIWRGIFDPADKQRKSERAKIISPATMQAVDATVAEIEEAVFGREQWFDILEDVKEASDPEQVAILTISRDHLLEKMEEYDVPVEMAKAFLIAAVYGTGIGKIIVDVKRKDYGDGMEEEVCVELAALEPYEFVPDPTTDNIDKMLGMAHETIIPLHEVKRLIKDGVYRNVEIGAYSGSGNVSSPVSDSQAPTEDSVFIREYHGLVPASKLLEFASDRKPADDFLMDGEGDDTLVEAIVTIGNDSIVLRAIKNPFGGDRSFIAYQHDTVPNYFWGRGVVEKAYHPQKALDGTTRARLDALSLVAHPMIAGDVTRLPRGMNMGVWPGKFWPTTGAPSDTLTGFNLGQVNPDLFSNAQDMERQVQTATGAMDPGAAYNPGQAGGATNTALSASMFIKRSRRTMQNIERRFIRPLVDKMYARYTQFDPKAFVPEAVFRPKGTLGIMAREFEQQQLTQMLALVPNESKPFFVMMKAIFDQSSSPHKAELTRAVDEWINPEVTPEQQEAAKKQEELQMRQQEAIVAELEAKARKADAEAKRAEAQAQESLVKADLADDEIQQAHIKNAIDLREVEAFEVQNELSALMQKLKAFDLAIKAKVAQAQIGKLEADSRKIQD